MGGKIKDGNFEDVRKENYETYIFREQIISDRDRYGWHKETVCCARDENPGDKMGAVAYIQHCLDFALEEGKPNLTGVYAKLLSNAISNIDTRAISKYLYERVAEGGIILKEGW